ncbi:TolC family protein [Deltaproteobacteria bacterium OttesenSCG-928-K17]|nr:TolC family protein [Deltaproteobacteria bacterium OttesenSCG-928-K17]
MSKLTSGLAALGLVIFLSACASPTRTKIAAPPVGDAPRPDTVFGEATLLPGGDPKGEIPIPITEDRPLTLEECLTLARRVSPAIDSADQSIAGAQWSQWQAVTSFLPTGSTAYQVTKHQDMANTNRSGTGGRFEGTTQYVWQGQVSQSVFTGGRNRANYYLAKLGVDSASIQKVQAREDLNLSVKQAYYSILATEKALEVAKTTVVNLQSHLNVAQNFYEVGMVPKNQVLEAEVELARAVQEETTLARDLTVAKTRMNIYLRQPVDKPIRIVDTLKYTPFPMTIQQCLEAGLSDSPEIRLGRNQVESAAKGVDVAKAGFYPEVGVVYTHNSMGNSAKAHGGWSNNDAGWNVATMATFNFWEWGRTKAEVEKSRVQLNRSINDLTGLEDNTKLEVTTNYQNLLSAAKNIDVSAKAVVSAAEDLRMVNERYLEQVATNTEVLDAQTRYSQAQYSHYQALYNYNLAWATLERSLGRQVLPVQQI